MGTPKKSVLKGKFNSNMGQPGFVKAASKFSDGPAAVTSPKNNALEAAKQVAKKKSENLVYNNNNHDGGVTNFNMAPAAAGVKSKTHAKGPQKLALKNQMAALGLLMPPVPRR